MPKLQKDAANMMTANYTDQGKCARHSLARVLNASLVGLLALAQPVAATTTPNGIWLSSEEVAKLPMSGKAWDHVKAAADGWVGTPKISDQDSRHDTNTLAIALVYARTGNAAYRTKAAAAI